MALGAWRFGHKAQVQFHTYSKDLPKYQVLIGIPITEPSSTQGVLPIAPFPPTSPEGKENNEPSF
jgi:hypothetical protein